MTVPMWLGFDTRGGQLRIRMENLIHYEYNNVWSGDVQVDAALVFYQRGDEVCSVNVYATVDDIDTMIERLYTDELWQDPTRARIMLSPDEEEDPETEPVQES